MVWVCPVLKVGNKIEAVAYWHSKKHEQKNRFQPCRRSTTLQAYMQHWMKWAIYCVFKGLLSMKVWTPTVRHWGAVQPRYQGHSTATRQARHAHGVSPSSGEGSELQFRSVYMFHHSNKLERETASTSSEGISDFTSRRTIQCHAG